MHTYIVTPSSNSTEVENDLNMDMAARAIQHHTFHERESMLRSEEVSMLQLRSGESPELNDPDRYLDLSNALKELAITNEGSGKHLMRVTVFSPTDAN